MLRNFKIIIIALLPLLCPLSSFAHELWIDTPDFTPKTSQDIPIELRNGEMFKGINLSFFNTRVNALYFDMTERVDAASRMGDIPAMTVPGQSDGLLRVVYISNPDTLTYAKWEKFVAFTNHKDAVWAQKDHIENGFPNEAFKEEYIRFSKALIGVGNARGSDTVFGLEIEITALANPYTDDVTQGLPVIVHYDSAPRALAQIEVFERDPHGKAQSFMIRTDAKGRATVPVKSGHTYLLDSVVLRPAPKRDSTQDNLYWQSLWAALTFKVP